MSLMLQTRQPNALAVLNALIKKLDISVSPHTLRDRLLEHPDFPSLLAISDCLSSWNVPHDIYRFDKEFYGHTQLKFPFIAHTLVNGGQFMFIEAIENGLVTYTNEDNKRYTITEKDFLHQWDGIQLYAEKDNESGEINYRTNLMKSWLEDSRLPILILILLMGIIISIINSKEASLGYFGLVALKISGVFVSTLLLMHSINSSNPFIQNLCGLGKKNSCNAILKSKAAKVTSWLSWSEVGMFYFSGSLICLLIRPDAIPILAFLNLGCLPYTFYSIGYQIRIRNWCILCCSIQVLLWLETIQFALNLSFDLHSYFSMFSFVGFLTLIICFVAPIAIWSFIKPYFLNSSQVRPLKEQLKKFKYDSRIFYQLLHNQKKYEIPEDLMPITIGNPGAEIVITMVSNPFCGPCATAHRILDGWLKNRDDLQLKILFVTANHDNDAKTKVARHVSSLSFLGDDNLVQKALNDWYSQNSKRYETWAEQYPVELTQELAVVTEKQKEWCTQAEVTFTPTILINGYKLIEPYHLNDIEYLLG